MEIPNQKIRKGFLLFVCVCVGWRRGELFVFFCSRPFVGLRKFLFYLSKNSFLCFHFGRTLCSMYECWLTQHSLPLTSHFEYIILLPLGRDCFCSEINCKSYLDSLISDVLHFCFQDFLFFLTFL